MKQTSLIKLYLFLAGLMLVNGLAAQKDSSGKGGVTIVSSFKPVLRESAKINFNATPPAPDTTKPRLSYAIPNQNLVLGYQPGSLKPLALSVDSAVKFDNSSYIKAGFGSLRTPFIQAGITLGDGETAGLNIYARHLSSQSKRDYQDFSNTRIRLAGYLKTGNNLQWDAALGMYRDKTYKYGYLPETLVLPVDSLKQSFQTISGRLAFHNINKTEFGLTYNPELKIDVFSDNHKNSESNTVLNAPLQKTIGQHFSVDLGITFDLTRFSPENKTAINNTLYYISPSVSYKSSSLRIQAGIRPSWDNGTFKMFPNLLADIGTEDKRFTFQAGWSGYLRKTSYQYLAGENPWLWLPDQLRNTWIEERFAGFKGTVGDHFSYAAKVGFNRLNNQPLFINDTTAAGDGKSFKVVYEDKMNVLNLGGELGYTIGEKFSLITGLQFNQFTGFTSQAKAWGMIPLELKAAMRLQVIRDLWLKTDLFAWRGAQYLQKNNTPERLKGAVDLNAGLEFRITQNLNLWAQFNNLFNREYQRWNQYPVYGFNFVGGIVFSFDQKN